MRHLSGMPIQLLNGLSTDMNEHADGVWRLGCACDKPATTPTNLGLPDVEGILKKVAAGVVVVGFGYLAYKTFSNGKKQSLNGFDFSKFAKDNQGLLIKAGMVVGGYAFVVRPLLKSIGVIQSSEEKKNEELATTNATSPSSPFNPNFYKSVSGAALLTKAHATQLADAIDDAIDSWSGDDEEEIYGVFRQLRAKTQVSWLADIFYQKYKRDLYSYLQASLSESEMLTINQIVHQLK